MKKFLTIFLSLSLFSSLLEAQSNNVPVRYDKIQNPYSDTTQLYTGEVPKYIKGITDQEHFPKGGDTDRVFQSRGIALGKIEFIAPFPLFVLRSENRKHESALFFGKNIWVAYRLWF